MKTFEKYQYFEFSKQVLHGKQIILDHHNLDDCDTIRGNFTLTRVGCSECSLQCGADSRVCNLENSVCGVRTPKIL